MATDFHKPTRQVGNLTMTEMPTSATALTTKRCCVSKLYVANNNAVAAVVTLQDTNSVILFRRTVDPLSATDQGQVLIKDDEEGFWSDAGLRWDASVASVWASLDAKAEGTSG